MNKNPKWRVGVSLSTHHVVEVEAPSAQEACQLALKKSFEDQEYYRTGHSSTITSCMVNDRESANFAVYVPEFIQRKPDEKQ